MRHFLAELKRRHVYDVALGYLAVAWMLLEFGDLVFPILGFPEWSLNIVLICIAIGFPIAMLLSWFFDLTSTGIVYTGEVPASELKNLPPIQLVQIGIIVVLVIAIAFLVYERQAANISVDEQQIHRLAVLPFVNLSEDESNEYFSDGVSEELLNRFANVPNLLVASRTSSFHYKGSSQSIGEIAAALGVELILEGSVQKSKNLVKITAQLIDGESGFHVWSESYTGELRDVFLYQENIARQVVSAIVPVLQPDQVVLAGYQTSSTEAYNEYLKGRKLLFEETSETVLNRALQHFQAAIDIDPVYVQAYAGICQASIKFYVHVKNERYFTEAERACNRALTRQQQKSANWEVHLAMAELYGEAGEFDAAIAEVDAASRLRRDSAEVALTRARVLAYAGKPNQAEAAYEQALVLDPYLWEAHLSSANFQYGQQNYALAIDQFQNLLSLVPDHGQALIGLGSTYYMQKDETSAQATWSRAEDLLKGDSLAALGVVYSNQGLSHYYAGEYASSVEMQRKATELRPDDHRPWGRLAESYRALGDDDAESLAYEKAITAAQKELQINRNNWETVGLLALYQAHSENLAEAGRNRDRMLSLDPNNPTAHYFAALINLTLGETMAAFSALEQAKSLGFSSSMIAADPDLLALLPIDEARYRSLTAD